MDTFEEKRRRQKHLEEKKRKAEQEHRYDNEWGGEKSPRFKVRFNRKDKHVGRFTYDLEEEGD